MKPCPYRRDHEFDKEGLCVHCYAEFPKITAQTPEPLTDKDEVTPIACPPWGFMYAPPASSELQKALDDLAADLLALPGVGPKGP